MDIKLTFRITFNDGSSTSQDLTVPADARFPIEKQTLALMQQALVQYAQVGLLRNPEPGKFFLICPSQIASVECELPSIVLAGANELPSEPKSPIITG
jgi:hypothetical protein